MNPVENYCHYSSHNFMFDGLSEWKLEKTYRRQIVAWWFNEKLRNRFVSLSTAHSSTGTRCMVYSQSGGLMCSSTEALLVVVDILRPMWWSARSQLMSCWLLITERFGVVKLSQIAMWKREIKNNITANVTKSTDERLQKGKSAISKEKRRKCYKLPIQEGKWVRWAIEGNAF